jgi:hypothetical protein
MMKVFTRVVASSYTFTSTSPAFSSSGVIPNSTAFFGSQGSLGGPTEITYKEGLSMQDNFGGGSAPTGLFNVLTSNVLEKPMFVPAASAWISSTGSVVFNSVALGIQTKYIDFQFIPSSAGSSGFVSVVMAAKGF